MKKILIKYRDGLIEDVLKQSLQSEGYEVSTFSNCTILNTEIEVFSPSLMIIDQSSLIQIYRNHTFDFTKREIVTIAIIDNPILGLYKVTDKLRVRGYLSSSDTYSNLIKCIKKVLVGELHLSDVFNVSDFLNPQESLDFSQLTKSERKISQLINHGYTNKKIADYLRISVRTVEVHRRNIRRKLGIPREVSLEEVQYDGLTP